MIWPLFRFKFVKFLRCFFEKCKTSKSHSEINGPLFSFLHAKSVKREKVACFFQKMLRKLQTATKSVYSSSFSQSDMIWALLWINLYCCYHEWTLPFDYKKTPAFIRSYISVSENNSIGEIICFSILNSDQCLPTSYLILINMSNPLDSRNVGV